MKKRRVLSAVLAASMFAMLLAGCGGGNQGSAEGSQAQQSDREQRKRKAASRLVCPAHRIWIRPL